MRGMERKDGEREMVDEVRERKEGEWGRERRL